MREPRCQEIREGPKKLGLGREYPLPIERIDPGRIRSVKPPGLQQRQLRQVRGNQVVFNPQVRKNGRTQFFPAELTAKIGRPTTRHG